MERTHDQSYNYFMNVNLFDHINLPKERINIPRGDLKESEIENFCAEYEKKIKEYGGVDLQILGLGVNGHIAFNEPESPFDSRTRIIQLKEDTIEANSRFFEKKEDVPRQAITMGIGTIMESKKIILIATGKGKAQAIKDSLEGEISTKCPASVLRNHPNVIFVLDKESSSLLSNK